MKKNVLNSLKNAIFFVILFGVFLPIFAENNDLVVKTPFPAENLSWSEDGSIFAMNEENTIIVRDAVSYEIKHVFSLPSVRSLNFSEAGGEKNSVISAFSGRGKLTSWDLFGTGGISFDVDLETVGNVSASAFSADSNYVAAGTNDGTVLLFFKLRYTHKMLSSVLKKQTDAITFLTFSRNSKRFASASADGTVVLWSTAGGNAILQVPYSKYTASEPIALFTDGTLAIVSGEKRISIYGASGDFIRTVISEENILGIQSLADGKTLAARDSMNRICFFSIATGEFSGYIAPCNLYALKSFAFSTDGRFVLQGYADGSIYKRRVEDSTLPPDAPMPPIPREMIAEENGADTEAWLEDTSEIAEIEEIDGEGDKIAENGENEGKDSVAEDENLDEKNELPSLFVPESVISIYAGALRLQDPFSWAFEVGAAWKNGTVFPPVYFGAGFDFQLGNAKSAFPYSYTLGGEAISSPKTGAIAIYAPIGVQLGFGEKKRFRAFMEGRLGARAIMLWQSQSGNFVSSSVHITALTGLYAGVVFYGVELLGGIEYDGVQKFMPCASLGYRVRLVGKK